MLYIPTEIPGVHSVRIFTVTSIAMVILGCSWSQHLLATPSTSEGKYLEILLILQGGMEGGREEEMEREREGGREKMRDGEKKREGGRDGEERGREGQRGEREREREIAAGAMDQHQLVFTCKQLPAASVETGTAG